MRTLYGYSDNDKVRAKPQTTATCATCNSELTPKCGEINIWHWAHKTKEDCDDWRGEETLWHIKWKLLVKPENTEVVIQNHRADIYTGKIYIELQNSSISVEDIEDREGFYDKLLWIFNVEKSVHNISITKRENYVTFRWKWGWRKLLYVKELLFLDLGKGLILQIKKIYYDNVYAGWGYLMTKESFKQIWLKDVLR